MVEEAIRPIVRVHSDKAGVIGTERLFDVRLVRRTTRNGEWFGRTPKMRAEQKAGGFHCEFSTHINHVREEALIGITTHKLPCIAFYADTFLDGGNISDGIVRWSREIKTMRCIELISTNNVHPNIEE